MSGCDHCSTIASAICKAVKCWSKFPTLPFAILAALLSLIGLLLSWFLYSAIAFIGAGTAAIGSVESSAEIAREADDAKFEQSHPSGERGRLHAELINSQDSIELPGGTAAQNARHQFRAWSDATGNFLVEAKCVKSQYGVAILEDRSGKMIDIAVPDLSDGDQQWLRENGLTK